MKREFSPSFAALFFASTLLLTILSSRGASMSRCMFPLEPPEYTTRMSFPMSINSPGLIVSFNKLTSLSMQQTVLNCCIPDSREVNI